MQQTSAGDVFQAPEILFLTLEFGYDSLSGEFHADVINRFVSQGRLKEPAKSKRGVDKGDFLFVLYGKDSLQQKEIVIDNPLIQNIEYLTNEGRLQRDLFHLEKVQHSLRLQLPEKSIFFNIYLAEESGEFIKLHSSAIRE